MKNKPKLAILTDSIRFDNQRPLKFFKKFKVVHFYHKAPYGDLKKKELNPPAGGAIQWKDLEDLEKKLIKFQPDIIQGAEPYASRVALKICLSTMKIAKILNIPYIFPVWENRPVKERFGPITGLFLRKILAQYAKNATLITHLNEGAKRNLLEVGTDPNKITRSLYGFYGIDTTVFRPKLKAQSLKSKAQKYILFVGRLDEAKGIQYLIKAWNSIKKDFPKVNLVFIGKGELENMVKGEQIIKIPWMHTKDLPSYFANALFTVYPSVTLKRWEEQVGTVNLQSLACGTPVVTTKSGAIPEYINDKVGILVLERNSKALANAMKKLLKNSNLRKKLSKNGIRYIKENFEVKKTIQKIEEILLKLINKNPRR